MRQIIIERGALEASLSEARQHCEALDEETLRPPPPSVLIYINIYI